MKRSSRSIFLIISLAFNLAVVTVYAVNRLDNEAERKSSCDHHNCRSFARSFGLPLSSAERFAEEMGRFSEDERKLRSSIMEARIELMDLFRAAPPDSEAIESKVEEISGLQGELEKIIVKRLLRANSVLSPSEKERFHRILMRRMCRELPSHHPLFERGGSCEEL